MCSDRHSRLQTANVAIGRRQQGLTLIELIVAMVIIAVAVAGVLLAINQSSVASTDPLIRKQAVAIAESLLEEIELMPYTFCDPTDPDAATATGAFIGANGCANLVEAIGPEPNESRGGVIPGTRPFNNVNDYNGYAMGPGFAIGQVVDIAGVPIPGLGAYTAQVAIGQDPLLGAGVPAGDSLLITVTVTGPAATTVALAGIRTRYAPNP